MKTNRQRAFSLIELMITVAIIGILGSLAYPAYQDSVLKGRRAQARTALGELLQQQERFLTQTNCYLAFSSNGTGDGTPTARIPAGTCGGVPVYPAGQFPFKTYSGDSPTTVNYLLSADNCPATAANAVLPIADCVRVLATPRTPDPKVGVLQMTSTGIKTCTGTIANPATKTDKLCWP